MGARDLLEREEALDAVRLCLERAAAGGGAVGLISGEAGVGKTALLEASVPAAEEAGMRVLRARCSALERHFAFGVIRQLLEPVVAGLDRRGRDRAFAGAASRAAVLFDEAPEPGPAAEPEHAVLNGLFRLVANLSACEPLLLAIDDVQWADVPTVRALEFAARRIEPLPVALLLAERSGPAGPDRPVELGALATVPGTVRVDLDLLSRESADRMVAAATEGDPDPAFLDAVWANVGGNPLLLDVACREIVTHGLRGAPDEADRLAALIAPGLAPIVLGRLQAVGPEAGRAALAAAVLGDRARFDDLAVLSGLAPSAARRALNRLADARILTPGGLRFAHDLVREAVLAAHPPSERDRLHRWAARQLRARRAPVAEIALHWFAATPAADPEAASDLHLAAREARRQGAVRVAIDLLRRALEEGAGPPERRRELLLDLGELELLTLSPECPGRMREALALGASGGDEARARAAIGRMLILNDPPAALAELETARAVSPAPDRDLLLEAAERECLLFLEELSPELAEHRRELAGAASPSVVGLAHRAIREALTGAPADRVRATAEAALRDDSLIDRIGPGGPTWNLLAHSLRWAEAAEPARRLIGRGEDAVRQGGLRAAGAFVEQALVYWHLELGSADRALGHAETGLAAVRGTDLRISEAALDAALAESLVRLDRAAEAAERAEAGLDAADGTVVEPFCLAARGLVRARTGRSAAAEEDLRRAVRLGEQRGWGSPRITRARMRLTALLAAAGDREAAAEAIAPDLEAAARIGSPGTVGATLRAQALTLEGEERRDCLGEAVSLLARSPLIHDLARARLELGREHLDRGRAAEAREVLADGLDGASRSGSAALSRELRSALAEAGGRPRRERRRGPAALTPSERRAAELAARGLSNREVAEALVVTRKTVEFHLRNAYAKLGIESRSGLAEALAAEPGPGQTLG